jgi:hypothetical protein
VKSTHSVGDRTVSRVLDTLVFLGHKVSLPFGGGYPYDLIWDDGTTLLRVQCKTGRIRNGVVVFNGYSVRWDGKAAAGYIDKADVFLVYCPENDRVYRVPVVEAGKGRAVSLRIDPTRNQQSRGIRWAKDFELSPL